MQTINLEFTEIEIAFIMRAIGEYNVKCGNVKRGLEAANIIGNKTHIKVAAYQQSINFQIFEKLKNCFEQKNTLNAGLLLPPQ